MGSSVHLATDLVFPIRDAATARFAVTKAECLHAAGLIDAQLRAALAAKAALALNGTAAEHAGDEGPKLAHEPEGKGLPIGATVAENAADGRI
jgi:hypothetical protein